MSIWQHRLANCMLVAFSLWMLICLVHASPALAQTALPAQPQVAQKNILLLYSYGHAGKGVAIFDEGLTSALSAGGIGANNLFFEYLDLERNKADQHYAARMQGSLLQKYANRKIDLIIAVQQPARYFLLGEGRMIAPGTPAITIQAAKVTDAEAGDRHFVSVLARFDIKGTLERALELFPQTQRVVFVSGSSEADRGMAAQAANIAAFWQGKLEFEYSGELSMEAMLQRVASLPPRSIVIFTQYNRDPGGRITVAYEVEALVVKAANAPVFGLYDFNLSNGGIGGSVVSVRGLGEKIGHVALDLLRGNLQLTQPVTGIDTEIVPMFDWRQIERWGGDADRLPKNSVFLNRSPTMWEQYARYVIWIAVLVVAQFLLIAILIVNKRRRTLAEKLLRESEARFRSLTAMSSDFYWESDAEHRLTMRGTANKKLSTVSAFQKGAQIGERRWEIPYLSPEEAGWQAHRAVLDAHLPFNNFELSRLGADGSPRHISISGAPVFDAAGAFTGYRGVGTDITERKQAEEALHIAATAFEGREGMTITDAAKVILRVNLAFTEITGYSAEETVGKTPSLFSSGRHDAAFYAAMWESIERTGSWQGEIWNRRKSGEVYPEWLSITAVIDDAEQTTHYVGTFTDITLRKTAEDKIKYLAFYDPLTQLPNRRLLVDRLKQTLASSTRNERCGALLYIDLDNFKTLNDHRGHDIGDLLLQQVAQRLSACIREGDTVARLGGDEFVVMLDDLSENLKEAATQAETVGEKILVTLNQPYQLANYKHHSTSSIGVTLFANHQGTIDELLKRADLAMYQAKAAGRNTLRFFDPEMQAVVTARAALDAGLREAIRKDQFVLHYQAQVDGEGCLTGAEALLRWQHPQRGLVSPAEFIPLAEDTGLILPLGHWVLETACVQLAVWAERPEMAHLTVAVNVSARQFRHRDFVDLMLAVLDHTGANPQRLKLELTESLLLDDVEDVIAKMTVLKAKGVGFSLDDFGTGYSSLSYLKRLPLDQLKIDQGFVKDILIDPNDAAIAKMIVALAQSMGLGVIAEGVETQAQRDFLASSGCHAYQGYFFSRPLPIDGFEQFAQRV